MRKMVIDGVVGEEELNNVGSDWSNGYSPTDFGMNGYSTNAHSRIIQEEVDEDYGTTYVDVSTETPPLWNIDEYGDIPDDLREVIDGINGNTDININVSEAGFKFDDSHIAIPHKHDIISIDLSPEELVAMIKVFKTVSVNLPSIMGLKVDEAYNTLTEYQNFISYLDERLDKYVKIRPWHPLLLKWVDNIGKKDKRKDD